MNGRASFPDFPLRRESSVSTASTSCFKRRKMTIFASFKAGSVGWGVVGVCQRAEPWWAPVAVQIDVEVEPETREPSD